MTAESKAIAAKIRYRLRKIRLLNFFEHDYENYGLSAEDIKVCELEYGAGVNIDSSEESIGLRVHAIFFKQRDDKVRNRLFGIETEHVFVFQNFQTDFRQRADGGLAIPDGLMMELLQISFNGTRGMLFSQAGNPVYKRMLLPMADLTRVLRELHKKSGTVK